MSDKNSEFLVLQGLKAGNTFITTNDLEQDESEKVKLANGEVAYRIIGYADTVEEAQILCRRTPGAVEAVNEELRRIARMTCAITGAKEEDVFNLLKSL